MDKTKAKKAVKKSESRKKSNSQKKPNKKTGADPAMINLAGMGVNPEIQAPRADMQPPTVNPYHAMGAMAPMLYAPGNMLPGYNYPVMVNPEE